MTWKTLLFAISFFLIGSTAQCFQIGEHFDYSPLEGGGNLSSCEQRINASVARIEIGENDPRNTGWSQCGTSLVNSYSGSNNRAGSSFLVSVNPPIMLTNRHNLRMALAANVLRNSRENNANPCASGRVRFNFTGIGQSVSCKSILYSFPYEINGERPPYLLDADAVFIELESIPPGAMALSLNPNPSFPSDVIVAGHPFGSDNLSAVRCQSSLSGNAPTHNCDTWSGSSGSAVVDPISCQATGIHKAGHTTGDNCLADATMDFANTCVEFNPNPSSCRNLFDSSAKISSALNLILNNQIAIKDENEPFFSYDRYRVIIPGTGPEDGVVPESDDRSNI